MILFFYEIQLEEDVILFVGVWLDLWISLFWGSYDAIMQSIDYGVFGLDSVLHGVIIAADNILGLFLLPLFGRLSDKTNTPFGSRKPFIVVGTVIAAVGFMGICVFASLGKDYFVPFIICLLVTLAAMAAYRSPALALVPDVNPDRFRSVANAVSNVVSVILTVVAMLYFYVFMCSTVIMRWERRSPQRR